MHIVIPTLGFGRSGGNRVLSRLATEWARAGHRVEFVAPALGSAPYFPTEADIVWVDDAGRRCESNDESAKPPGGLRGVARRLRALRKGLGAVARDADVVLANHSLTVWPVLLSRTRGERWYYVQAYEPELFEGGSIGARVLSAQARAGYFMPLHRIVNAPMYQRFGVLRADAWVPPGLDLDTFHPAAPHDSREVIRVGCIGRREEWKGTRYAVDAFVELRATDPRYRMSVAYGNLTPEQAALDGVEVVVPRNDAELADYYRSLDVMIAPGLIQLGAPHYPVMEALACGVPVVTTGYMPADETNAWLVPLRDAHAIAEAVRSIVAHPSEAARRRDAGLARAAEFAWPRVAQAMIDLFTARAGRPA